MATVRHDPGVVRDAIIQHLTSLTDAETVKEIHAAVEKKLGRPVPRSSVRSYLNLNEGRIFVRIERGRYKIKS